MRLDLFSEGLILLLAIGQLSMQASNLISLLLRVEGLILLLAVGQLSTQTSNLIGLLLRVEGP